MIKDFFLLIIAFVLLLMVSPIMLIYNILQLTNTSKGNIFLKLALAIDRFGNIFGESMLNDVCRRRGTYRFGDGRETISSALGKIQEESSVIHEHSFNLPRVIITFKPLKLKYKAKAFNYKNYSKFKPVGNALANFLDFVDPNHCKKSIKRF